MMSFLFLKLFQREATLLKGMQLCAKGNDYAAQDCDTSDSDLLVVIALQLSLNNGFMNIVNIMVL